MVLERAVWVCLFIAVLVVVRRLLTPALPGDAPPAGTGHTLFYFWGPGCAACAAAKPMILALSRDVPLCLRSIDASQDPAEARKWDVLTVPTVILLNEAGEITYRSSGALSPQRLRVALGLNGPESSS